MNRPTSITVLGILNIIFGAIGLMGIALSIVMMFIHPAMDMKNPVLDLMKQNPAYALYTNISMVIGAVFTIALCLSGIGLLMLRPWGRWLSIAYAVFGLVSLVVNTLINYFFLLTPLLNKLAALPPGQEKAAAMGGIVGLVGGLCIGPIYPIVLLIFMFRPNVMAAFGAQDSADQFRF
jgi:hypothetical protein